MPFGAVALRVFADLSSGLFNTIDSDGSGMITGAELQAALPHVAAAELQSLIAEFDTNGDGVFAHCG